MLLRMLLHEARAEHRRQRERDQARDEDGGGDGQSEFAKQPADDPAHEQERDEHRDQRKADREHREGDLARAFERCLEWSLAILDVAVDVLDHHNGIVDHETDRDGKRHQRNVIETEIEQIHRRERAEQRERHRDARNECRPEIAQEQKDDQHDQADGEHERELDIVHRGADHHCAVENHVDLHGRRHVGGEPRQPGLDLIDGLDDVDAGLLEDIQQDARIVVLVGGDVAIGRLGDRLTDIAQPNGSAIAVGQDDIFERPRLGDLVVGRNGE